MANIALATNQNDYLEIFIAQYKRKPNQKEFRNWQQYVNLAKARLKSAATNRAKKKEKAINDWTEADQQQRLRLMAKAVSYRINAEKADPYQDSIIAQIKEEKHYARLFSYLVGFDQANAKAEEDEVSVSELSSPRNFIDGFMRRGWKRAKCGLERLSLEAQAQYLSSPDTVRL